MHRLDHRLRQVDRVLDDLDVREVVAVADEVLGQRRLIARGHAVAAVPPLLDVRRLDHEPIAFPTPGREAHPGVRRVGRRVRPAVHPDRPRLLVGADVVLDRDDVLRSGVLLVPDADVERAPVDVVHGVDATLLFVVGQPRGVPTLGPLTGGGRQRNARVVAQPDAGPAIGLVFVLPRGPISGEINLRSGRTAGQHRGNHHDDNMAPCRHPVPLDRHCPLPTE